MARLDEALRRKYESIWLRLVEHPFVIELYSGRLPMEKFRFYLIQDYHYLLSVMRAFALLASKADIETARLALEIAYEDAVIELENYKRLIPRVGLSMNDVLSSEPAPTNLAYMNFILSTCSLGSPAECLAALLPCFWSYQEIAERHQALLRENKVKVYVDWAVAYLSKDYGRLVRKLRDCFEKLAAEHPNKTRIEEAFRIASRYEYMFWEMAYNLERWPL